MIVFIIGIFTGACVGTMCLFQIKGNLLIKVKPQNEDLSR